MENMKLIKLKSGNWVVVTNDDVMVGDYFLDRGYENVLLCTKDSIGVFHKIIQSTFTDVYGQIPKGLSFADVNTLIGANENTQFDVEFDENGKLKLK